MTSGSAARRRRARMAAAAEAARHSGIATQAGRGGQRVIRWTVDRDPYIALADADRLRAYLEREAIPALTRAARQVGYTWADIGEALGLSRQAAHGRLAGQVGEE